MAEGTAPVSGQCHISTPKAFAGGDVCKWLTRFEICTRANAWDNTRKALTLPTLLEDSRVVAYASRALTQSGKNYSGVQRECLAVVYATIQFRHYLLGCPFQLYTDHAPLQS